MVFLARAVFLTGPSYSLVRKESKYPLNISELSFE